MLGRTDRVERRRAPAARCRALVPHRRHSSACRRRDEPVWKSSSPAARRDARPQRGRRSPARDGRATPSRFAEPARHGGERHALAQEPRAHEVETDVAVAEREPALAAEPLGHARAPGTLSSPYAPAAFLVEEAGERVEDGVEVGRDVQAEDLDVVADVHDRRHALRADRPRERVHEPRASETAAEDGTSGFTLEAVPSERRTRMLIGCSAIVPVKGLDGAKTRLAPLLRRTSARSSSLEMLERRPRRLPRVGRHPANATRHARPQLAPEGVDVLVDAGAGHAAALAAALADPRARPGRSSSWPTARS